MAPFSGVGASSATWGPRARRVLVRLAVVALATGGAAAGRFAMTPLIGLRIPMFTFYPAIMVCSAYGGLWPGLLCTVASSLIIAYHWIPPERSFAVTDPGEAIALAVFFGTGVAISILHESLKRRRRQLVAARAEAEYAAREAMTANRSKDEFLSVLGHELRTPLTAILGWANVLRTRSVGTAAQARALEAIERNALAQARIVDDILDVSRIINGKLRLELQPIEVGPAVASAVEVVRPAAEAKGVMLVLTVDPAAGIIHGDAVRVQQIAWNLVINAVKFTPRGGRIDVRVERDASAVRLTVTDTGEGIGADFLPYVFDRFRQADASSTRAHGGLGLGLAIVRHLVDGHGGKIAAASGGPGKGATFTVRLPLRSAVRAEPEARAAASGSAATSLTGLRVLVVDDDPDSLDLVAMVLRAQGAAVTIAASSDEGIRALQTGPIDVLVADIDMPGEDGYDLMRRAKDHLAHKGRDFPALALTARAGSGDVQATARAGFQAHLAKPVLADELIRVVGRLGGYGVVASASL